MNFTATNRPPIEVSSTNITVILDDSVTGVNATAPIIAELMVIDPDVNENFSLTFSRANLRALPVEPKSTVISDDGTTVNDSTEIKLNRSIVFLSSFKAQVYNISVVDLEPPTGLDKEDYLTDITANITDSDGNSISHEFFIHYVTKSNRSTIASSTPIVLTVSCFDSTKKKRKSNVESNVLFCF